MRTSLQFKLLYSFMLIIIITLAGVSFGVSLLIKEQVLENKQQELISHGSELARTIAEFSHSNKNNEQLTELLNNVDNFLDLRIWVFDGARQIIAISVPRPESGGKFPPPQHMNPTGSTEGKGMGKGMHGMMTRGEPRLQNNILENSADLDPVYNGQILIKLYEHPYYSEKMLVVGIPIVQSNGIVDGAVLLHAPITRIDAFMRNVHYYIGAAGLIASLFALLLAHWLTRSIVRPLTAMQQTASAMAHGDYSTLVTIDSHDELGKLGLALNSLAHDLDTFINKIKKEEKLRRDFVANVSHELRTPITIIRGYNEALMDGTIDDPALTKKYHCLVRDETLRLEQLIKELLDLSRLQAENIPLEMEKLPLAEIVDSAITLVHYRAQTNQIILIAPPPSGTCLIVGNGDRIIQLLLILLDNALKYTPSGGNITLHLAQSDHTVTLTVTDTGSGIPADDVPYLWERFYKVDTSHSRATPGTGLGLAIAKQIIDLHHATAQITSQVNHGTSVTIAFPAFSDSSTL